MIMSIGLDNYRRWLRSGIRRRRRSRPTEGTKAIGWICDQGHEDNYKVLAWEIGKSGLNEHLQLRIDVGHFLVICKKQIAGNLSISILG